MRVAPSLVMSGLLLVTGAVDAYIGPGSGLSVLGSLWTVLVGIVLAIAAIVTWPLRIWWRRRKQRAAAPGSAATTASSSSEPPSSVR